MSNTYWLNTFTGRRFNLLEPKHEDIDIVDIAAALSRPALVKEIDLEMLDVEAAMLLNRHPVWPAGTPREPRTEVRDMFMRRQRIDTEWRYDFMARAVGLGLAGTFDSKRLEAARWGV